MRIFLSYVRENRGTILRLAADLEAAGFEVWIDARDLGAGQRWQLEIRNAIENGAAFIACFSTQANERPDSYMWQELEIAFQRLLRLPQNRQWFIPVILDASEPPRTSIGGAEYLSDFQYVRLGEDWNGGVAKILKALENQRAASAGRTSVRRGRSWRRALFGGLASLAVIAATVLGFEYRLGAAQDDWVLLTNLEVSPKVVELREGSVVTLAKGTRLRVHVTSSARELSLESGEAVFRVAKVTNAPFTVFAVNGRISALATEFDVRLDPEQVLVSVTEGAVEVAPWVSKDSGAGQNTAASSVFQWQPVKVGHGQDMSYSQKSASEARPAEVEETIQWRTGRLVYSSQSLGKVVEEVMRYSGREIAIDESAAKLPFTGMVKQGAVEEWVNQLPKAYHVTVVRDAQRIEIHYRRQGIDATPDASGRAATR